MYKIANDKVVGLYDNIELDVLLFYYKAVGFHENIGSDVLYIMCSYIDFFRVKQCRMKMGLLLTGVGDKVILNSDMSYKSNITFLKIFIDL